MEFPINETVLAFAESYYKKNVKQHVKSQRNPIYLPDDCSTQMANLVKDLVIKKTNFRVSLRKTRSTPTRPSKYKLLIEYPS
jgi:hypothetical protein